MAKSRRKLYIDNLRILLSMLVVMHHWAITYGAPGGWYYIEGNDNEIAVLLMTIFVATNQAFFMGMFFMISSYFLEKSLRRKSGGISIMDKLKRLGIPLLIFVLLFNPIVIYLEEVLLYKTNYGFLDFIKSGNWFSWGPMWFVEALLYLSIITIILKPLLTRKKNSYKELKLPSDIVILITAVFLGGLSFLVRLVYPVGRELEPFSFQLGHFSQYIFLFIIGIFASRNNWFDQITFKRAKNWFWIILAVILIGFPSIFILGGAEQDVAPFMGGWHKESLMYSIWEQIVGFGIIISLLGIFKQKLNVQGPIYKAASASAYTVYIIHPLFLILCSALILNLGISSTAKFLLFAPVVVIVTFFTGNIIRKLPLARKVL